MYLSHNPKMAHARQKAPHQAVRTYSVHTYSTWYYKDLLRKIDKVQAVKGRKGAQGNDNEKGSTPINLFFSAVQLIIS